MNARAFRILEFEKIQQQLKKYAVSGLGKESVNQMNFFTKKERIEEALNETQQAYEAMEHLGEPPLHGVYPIKDALVFVEKGGVLTPDTLLNIADSLRTAADMKEYGEELEGQALLEKISLLGSYPHIVRAVEKAIISEDRIADDASSELKRIRRAMIDTETSIRNKLEEIVQSDRYEGQLQDRLVTMREGRYVVPIKAEFKNKFSGVVHSMSGSEATAYIEPMSVVNLNNRLRTLEGEEEEEIRRILRELSLLALEVRAHLEVNQDILQNLDFIFAKAKLARHMDATKPKVNEEGIILLKEARHPLLNVKHVVPISVALGDDFHILVITGPNTGGKTVSLKTIGLLQLMAQSGLFIPCDEGSQIGVFDEIFTDIGDEQSIEQSLSTFSSHMTNIVSILKNLPKQALVLLDELGAGTDPTEGAALAMSILEELRQRKVHTVATTHYSQLKTYALTTEGVKNAAVEFDVESLRPTYRLLIGAPGKSNAFEISKRLGLSEDLIQRARGYIGSEEQKMEDLFANLEQDRLQMERHKMELEVSRHKIQQLEKQLEEEAKRNQASREKILQKAKEEAKEIILETKEYSDRLIKEIKQLDQITDKEKARKMQQLQESIREKHGEATRADAAFLNKTVHQEIQDLKLGEEVEIVTMGQRGYVISLPDNQNNVVVQVGILKINTDLNTLRRVQEVDRKEGKTNAGGVLKAKAATHISNELDIRGKNVEEGMMEVDDYLDDVVIVGLQEVQIIHGKGTGILRKGIQEHLKKHPYVKSIRDGKYNEGGLGVTVVTLK